MSVVILFGDDKLEEVISNFVNAFNKHDVNSVAALLSDDVTYVSTSGESTKGKSEVVKLYKKALEKYGSIAKYQVAKLDNKTVAVILYKTPSGDFERQVYKTFELEGDKISKIVASSNKEDLTRIRV